MDQRAHTIELQVETRESTYKLRIQGNSQKILARTFARSQATHSNILRMFAELKNSKNQNTELDSHALILLKNARICNV